MNCIGAAGALGKSPSQSEIGLLNVAVMAASPSRWTVQAPVPVQAPVHPLNVEPLPGAAVSETAVPEGNDALQALPQSMPTGADMTRPTPLPAGMTVSL